MDWSSEYNKRLLQSLANSINSIKHYVRGGGELSPEQMKIIKEMRDNLNDIITEDMYK